MRGVVDRWAWLGGVLVAGLCEGLPERRRARRAQPEVVRTLPSDDLCHWLPLCSFVPIVPLSAPDMFMSFGMIGGWAFVALGTMTGVVTVAYTGRAMVRLRSLKRNLLIVLNSPNTTAEERAALTLLQGELRVYRGRFRRP